MAVGSADLENLKSLLTQPGSATFPPLHKLKLGSASPAHSPVEWVVAAAAIAESAVP